MGDEGQAGGEERGKGGWRGSGEREGFGFLHLYRITE